ncbi:pilin [Patescibacteria group bacterium]|nr:pilin [Patescibacteria group bacterium]
MDICCCNIFFGKERCRFTTWRVGQLPEEVCRDIGGGYPWSGPPGDCPGEMPFEETSDEIYFTPQAPIPGVFEGPQLVDGSLLSRYLRSFYVYFVWIVGILATVMIMWSGIQWITAAGDASKVTNAKATMNGAIIGLALTLS